MKIPTQKGEHSCKCTELSLKRKEGIGFCALLTHVFNLHNLYITWIVIQACAHGYTSVITIVCLHSPFI